MKCLNLRVTLLILITVTELKLSYQVGCPYLNWYGGGSSQIQPLTASASKNALVKYGTNEYMSQQISNLNMMKPSQEAGLSASNMDSMIKSYFHSNNIRKEDQKFLNPYLEALKSAELECALPPVSCLIDSSNYYYRSYDGSCNNLENPRYGMAKTRYSRILPPKYGDEIYAPSKTSTGYALPSSRVLSLALYGEETILDDQYTLMSMQFGQFVSHDINQLYSDGLPANCCTNCGHKMCYPIPLHPLGPIAITTGRTCLHFARSLSDMDVSCAPSGLSYAEKITTTTAFLDLSSIYGNSLEQNTNIRLFKDGLLKKSCFNNKAFPPIHSSECPANNEQCFNIPDSRNQITPTVTVLHTIFLREHNRLAKSLARINPQYTDEKLFQVARKINIAQFQKITYYDWLPLILGPIFSFENRLIYSSSPYDYINDHDRNLDPAPLAESAAAALRYMHHAIPGWFSQVSIAPYINHTFRLSDYLDRGYSMQLLTSDDNFDSLILGLAIQPEKRVDNNVDREIKHHFARNIYDVFGTDLKSIDIQRGRDFGLATYNDLREICGLPRACKWSDLSQQISIEKIELLKKFYYTPNDVELSIGGSLERHAPDSMFGPTFQCIIAKQFLKTRVADRFFYENDDTNSGFTRGQLAEIRKITLASILCANGNSLQSIQSNVFKVSNHHNGFIKCKDFPQLDLSLWEEHIQY